jgi:K+-sensing histidine kinase KdpD
MDDLAAAVIHDVKNQLAELALRLERRGDTTQETSIVFDAARRLTDLLLASRQQSGQLRANIDSTSPGDLLLELCAEYQGLFPNLTFAADTSNAPAFAFYDVALIRLALSNAVHNAGRFAKSSVTLSASSKDSFLVFEIADDGPGFPDEMLGAAPASPTFASARGTGLGIYLAGKIAELHEMEGRRGSVRLSNGDGACFRLSLP